MTFKTGIKIKDTGKRRVESASAEETEKVNGGNWITLKPKSITYDITPLVNNRPALSKFENDDATEIYGVSEIDKIGIGIPTWTIQIGLDTTSTSDLQTFANLVRLCKTKGVKQITGVDDSKSIINWVNYYDDYFQDQSKSSSGTLSELWVRIAGLKIRETADKKYSVATLTLFETS